jgi:hypothetical protein
MDEENVQSNVQSDDQGDNVQSDDQGEDQGVEQSESSESVHSDESTQEGETEEQGTEEQPQTFLREEDVPAELKPHWKEMNKKFTQEMQKMKSVQADADAYRELMEQELKTAQSRPALEDNKQQLAENMGLDTENLTPEQQQTLGWLNQQIATKAEEMIKPIKQQLVNDRVTRELNQVRDKYPDFDQYQPQIRQVLKKYPMMDFDAAYKYVTWDDKQKTSEDKGLKKVYEKIESKKKAKVAKSSKSAVTGESPDYDSVEDMFRAAKKEHGYA